MFTIQEERKKERKRGKNTQKKKSHFWRSNKSSQKLKYVQNRIHKSGQ